MDPLWTVGFGELASESGGFVARESYLEDCLEAGRKKGENTGWNNVPMGQVVFYSVRC